MPPLGPSSSMIIATRISLNSFFDTTGKNISSRPARRRSDWPSSGSPLVYTITYFPSLSKWNISSTIDCCNTLRATIDPCNTLHTKRVPLISTQTTSRWKSIWVSQLSTIGNPCFVLHSFCFLKIELLLSFSLSPFICISLLIGSSAITTSGVFFGSSMFAVLDIPPLIKDNRLFFILSNILSSLEPSVFLVLLVGSDILSGGVFCWDIMCELLTSKSVFYKSVFISLHICHHLRDGYVHLFLGVWESSWWHLCYMENSVIYYQVYHINLW